MERGWREDWIVVALDQDQDLYQGDSVFQENVLVATKDNFL